MKNKTIFLILIAILALALIVGCVDESENYDTVDDSEEVPSEESETEDEEETTLDEPETVPEESDSDVKEFTMTAKQWEFSPDTITVKKGDKVKLTITSEDVSHGFILGEYRINERLEPGETTVVEFDANLRGTFTFFCSVPCGAGHTRMNGKLVVE